MELSSRDKELLDSFDISIFKSAVAYLENARHTSCQPGKSSNINSPQLNKLKFPRDRPPPVQAFEGRFEVLSKKYANEANSAKIRTKQAKRPNVGIFNQKTGLENEDLGNLQEIDWKARYSGQSRKHLRLFKGSR